MKRNLNIPFVSLKGNPVIVKDEQGNESERLIGETIAEMLVGCSGSEAVPLSGSDKLTLYRIARRITDDASAVELTSEEVVLLKKVLEPQFTVGAWGQVYDAVEV